MSESDITRLIIKVTRDTLPQVKDKYPFLYLERGRLEIDDSSAPHYEMTGIGDTRRQIIDVSGLQLVLEKDECYSNTKIIDK